MNETHFPAIRMIFLYPDGYGDDVCGFDVIFGSIRYILLHCTVYGEIDFDDDVDEYYIRNGRRYCD